MSATPRKADAQIRLRIDNNGQKRTEPYRTTMTQDDIDNGRLICDIGVAPTKPAEFVIFRMSQKTLEAPV